MTDTMTQIEDNGTTMTPVCQVHGCGWRGEPVTIQRVGQGTGVQAFDIAWDDLISHLAVDHPWLLSA